MRPNTTMTKEIIAQGRAYADLGNKISDSIVSAVRRGMELDEAVCIVVQVAADYARGEYGDPYLRELADVILKRATMPMPEV